MKEKILVLTVLLTLFSYAAFTLAEETPKIKILDKGFDPVELTVEKGATVRWISAASGIHILAGNVRSPKLENGDSFEHVFEETGEYHIVDVVSKTRGKIIVVEAIEEAPAEEITGEVVEEIIEEEATEEAEEEVIIEIIEEEVEEVTEEEVIIEIVEEEEVIEEVPEEEREGLVITVQETELVNLEATATDPDADPLTYTYSSPLDENGKWQTDYEDEGEYTVKVTVSDGELSTSQEVLLIVEKKEEKPVIVYFYPAEKEINIKEGDSVDFRITANDLNNDELSYTWKLDGEEVSTSDKLDFFADYKSSGSNLLKIYVSDGTLTTTKDWRLNIEDVDRAPILMPIQNIFIKETQKLTIYVNATDPDEDPITYSAQNMPSGARFDGNVFRWFPGYDSVTKEGIVDNVLDKYHLLMDSYVVTFIAKGKEKEAKQDVRINVKDVNREPVLASISNIVVTEGDFLSIKASASDPDGDELEFSYSGWLTQDSYKTTYDDEGEYTVKVTVSDGWLEDSQDVKITVKKKNRAPVFKEIGSYDVDEGETLEIRLSASDPDDDELVFSADNITNAMLHDNIFRWTPGYDLIRRGARDFRLTFTVTDGTETKTRGAVVTVNNVNQAPEIISAEPKDVSVKRNEPVVFRIEAEDLDNDRLSYKWVFGMFEKYEDYGNVMKRLFTSTGNKKIKVIVSDGKEDIIHEWNIKVI